MANVVSYGIRPGSVQAGLAIEGNNRELEYVITFDEEVYDTDEVLLVSFVPYPGVDYPFNDTLKCTAVSAQPEANNQAVWRIRATYDASGVAVEEGKAYGFKIGVNPVNKAARGAYYKKIGTNSTKVAQLGSRFAEPTIPIENSAEDPFAEPLPYIEHNVLISWWQIENAALGDLIESGQFSELIGTVNYDEVSFCGQTYYPYTVLIKDIQPEQYYYRDPLGTNSEMRWKCTYVMEISNTVWTDIVLDQGFDAYLRKTQDDSTLIKRPIRLGDLPYNTSGSKVRLDDAQDDYAQNPVKLDGQGKILASGDDPVYIEYLVKKPRVWSMLSLATEIAK